MHGIVVYLMDLEILVYLSMDNVINILNVQMLKDKHYLIVKHLINYVYLDHKVV
jgi:hypothetical protein